MHETLPELCDSRTTVRCPGPGPDDIRAAWAEYQSAKSASAATFGCGSVELVLEASDRCMRAEDTIDVLCEALGRSLPAARRHIDAARAAQASYVAETEHMTPADIVEASNAALRLEERLARARRGIVKVSLAAGPAKSMDAAPCTEARRSERPRQRSHRRQAKPAGGDDDGDGGGESPGAPAPGAPATLAEIERLICRLVPSLVRAELQAHDQRSTTPAAAPPPAFDALAAAAESAALHVARVRAATRARKRSPGGRP